MDSYFKVDEPMLVSVVMSVYNVNQYPIRGIETIIDQNFTDFEFIIIDDGSDQETRKILEKYAEHDCRIKLLVNDRNIKLASSLNRGIRVAKGNYIARADANIDYHEKRLEKQLGFMGEHPDIDILGSNFLWATEGKIGQRSISLPEKHQKIVRALSKGNCICHPSVIFKKNRLMNFGPYQEGFGKGEDYHLWIRTRKNLKFHNLQEPLLLKWHRAEPWKDKLLEYFINNIRTRISGMKTSPNLFKDIFYFPKCLSCFLSLFKFKLN